MIAIDPNDRATVLREAADCAYRIARRLDDQRHDQRAQGAWDVENALRAELRRMADEEQTTTSIDRHDSTAMLPESDQAQHQQRVTRARHEGAIEALRSAAEHVSIGAAVGPIPAEVRPAVEAWLCRLAEQRRDRARKEAVRRMRNEP